MTKVCLAFCLLLVFGCHFNSKLENNVGLKETTSVSSLEIETIPSIDSSKININFKPKGNYASILQTIKSDRNTYFKEALRVNSTKALDSASKYLYSKLLNDIVPHWYGTTWDFNGHTNTPNDGEIACGYFVSTTLKHLGLNLNRYKMAQQAGLTEARVLQPKSELQIFSNLSFKALKKKVNAVYKDGLYFVGLDNHVGYVLLKDQKLYFLHSSYCDNLVVMELAETSPCFGSNIYVFAEITTNKNLIKKWILNDRLNVPTS